jgi:hypothetical protein
MTSLIRGLAAQRSVTDTEQNRRTLSSTTAIQPAGRPRTDSAIRVDGWNTAVTLRDRTAGLTVR